MNVNNRMRAPMGVKEIPTGVKVLSVLYYVLATLGIISLILGSFTVLGGEGSDYTIIIILAIFLLGASILCFFLGRGLWRGQNWSRIIAIAIAILSIIVSIAMIIVLSSLSTRMIPQNNALNIGTILDIFRIDKFIPRAIIYSLINAIIAIYLIFSNKVKEAFK